MNFLLGLLGDIMLTKMTRENIKFLLGILDDFHQGDHEDFLDADTPRRPRRGIIISLVSSLNITKEIIIYLLGLLGDIHRGDQGDHQGDLLGLLRCPVAAYS